MCGTYLTNDGGQLGQPHARGSKEARQMGTDGVCLNDQLLAIFFPSCKDRPGIFFSFSNLHLYCNPSGHSRLSRTMGEHQAQPLKNDLLLRAAWGACFLELRLLRSWSLDC